jgi:GAF domain-containing protein
MDRLNIFKARFSILQHISEAMCEVRDIRSIANVMLDLAIGYTNAETGSLMLFNDRNHLYILTARGLDPQFIREYNSKMGEGIAGTVALNRRPVLVEDIEKDPRFTGVKRDHYKTKSFVSCPIMNKTKILGVLNINDKRDGTPFAKDEFDLLKIIANHAAIALENVLLLNQLEAKAAESEKVNLKLIESYLVKNKFLTRISHELRTPLNSVKGAIYYLQQNDAITKNDRKEFQNIITAETDKLITLVENLLNFLRFEEESRILEKTILNLADILKELAGAKSIKNALTQKGIDLKVSVPDDLPDIVGDKNRVMQLFMNLIDGFSFYLEQGDTIEITAQSQNFVSVVLALPRKLPKNVIPSHNNLKNVFQLENQEQRLKLYLAWSIIEVHRWGIDAENTDGACRITLTIPKSSNEKFNTLIDISMDSFAEFISQRLNLDICSIMLSDDLTNELTVRAARGLDDEIVKRTRIKMGDKIAGWVALEGKPLFIENIESDPRFSKKNVSQYTTKSLMSFPLKIGGRVIGVMNLNNKKNIGPFTMKDYAVAETISEKISQFMESLYTGSYREEDFQKLMKSFNELLPQAQSPSKEQESLSSSSGDEGVAAH